MIFYNIHNS